MAKNNILEKTFKRTWAEIDLDAVRHNFNLIKKASNNKKICCVIKADAYGHGAVQLAKIYLELGASLFAVADIDEAIELRNNNIDKDILILGYTPPECAKLLSEYKLSQCVYSYSYGKSLHDFAEKEKVKLKIHLKIDTGMGRIGFICLDEKSNGLKNAVRILQMPNFKVEGIFTHMAIADGGENGKEFTTAQYTKFIFAKKHLEGNGAKFKYYHCSNSASILDFSDFADNTVRAGIILYGMEPSFNVVNKLPFIPVMTLKTTVSHVKDVARGQSISYGRTFIAKQKMRVATISIGYADGFLRGSYIENRYVLVNGQPAKILGRVCMDQVMIDVTGISCHVGNEVIVFGKDKGFTPNEVADNLKTIGYELTCSVGYRVPRVYMENGKIVEIKNNLLKNI